MNIPSIAATYKAPASTLTEDAVNSASVISDDAIRRFEATGTYTRFNVARTNYSSITKDNFLVNYNGSRFTINSTNVSFNAGGAIKLVIDSNLTKINSNLEVTNSTKTNSLQVTGATTSGSLQVTGATTSSTLKIGNSSVLTGISINSGGTLTINGTTYYSSAQVDSLLQTLRGYYNNLSASVNIINTNVSSISQNVTSLNTSVGSLNSNVGSLNSNVGSLNTKVNALTPTPTPQPKA